jgi:DNA (cytosine-5)-methyltransferase 1
VTSKISNQSVTTASRPRLKALSFFSGCMGLDLGLEQEGIEILLACENDPVARSTIKFNRPDIALIEDILDYSAAEIREKAGLKPSEEIDLIVGSPPCQAFSTAGRQQRFDEQRDRKGNLFLTFIDLIAELKPKFAVIETVPGLLYLTSLYSSHEVERVNHSTLGQNRQISDIFSFIVRRLEAAGYSVSFNLYNAADFGSPQTRRRVIITCNREGKQLPYLTPTHANKSLDGLPQWQTLRDALEEISDDEHSFIKLPEAKLKYYQLLKPGQNWQNLPVNLQQEILDRVSPKDRNRIIGLYQRLAWDKPSPTLFYRPLLGRNSLVHPEANRLLSIAEYKRIQDLPDNWKIVGNLDSQYRQVGDATPCSLGRAIARMLLTHVYGETLSDSAYRKKIENKFNSFKTLDEWRKEISSANWYSKKEVYIQTAISSYLTIKGITNETEVVCGKYLSDRLDIIIRSENTVVEVKKIINKESLRKGVSQLNTYAKNTGMTRKILIGLPDIRESEKLAEIKELIDNYINNTLNLEIHMLDLEQQDLNLDKIFNQRNLSNLSKNILTYVERLSEVIFDRLQKMIIDSINIAKNTVVELLVTSENILNMSQKNQLKPSY